MSLTTPLQISSIDLDNPAPEAVAELDKRQCSRCGEWQPLEEFRLEGRGYRRGQKRKPIRRGECRGCHRIYKALVQSQIAYKDADGRLVVKLPDGTEASLVSVATSIARRGYRLAEHKRQPPKPLAAKDAEAVASQMKKKGYQLEKLGKKSSAAKKQSDDNGRAVL